MIVNLLLAVVFRKVLKEIFVGELQPDETVDAMREAKLLSTVCVIFIVFYLWWVMRLSLQSLCNHFNEPNVHTFKNIMYVTSQWNWDFWSSP